MQMCVHSGVLLTPEYSDMYQHQGPVLWSTVHIWFCIENELTDVNYSERFNLAPRGLAKLAAQ